MKSILRHLLGLELESKRYHATKRQADFLMGRPPYCFCLFWLSAFCGLPVYYLPKICSGNNRNSEKYRVILDIKFTAGLVICWLSSLFKMAARLGIFFPKPRCMNAFEVF